MTRIAAVLAHGAQSDSAESVPLKIHVYFLNGAVTLGIDQGEDGEALLRLPPGCATMLAQALTLAATHERAAE